jgi:hypothetical protein
MSFSSSAKTPKVVQLALMGAVLMGLAAGLGFVWRGEFTARLIAGGLLILGALCCSVSTHLWLSRQGTRSTAFQVFLWVLLLAVASFQAMSLWFGWLAQQGG